MAPPGLLRTPSAGFVALDRSSSSSRPPASTIAFFARWHPRARLDRSAPATRWQRTQRAMAEPSRHGHLRVASLHGSHSPPRHPPALRLADGGIGRTAGTPSRFRGKHLPVRSGQTDRNPLPAGSPGPGASTLPGFPPAAKGSRPADPPSNAGATRLADQSGDAGSHHRIRPARS